MPRRNYGNTGPTTCKFCNKKFSAERYYLSHFKYQVNAKCKRLFELGFEYPEPEPQLPQKRAYGAIELPSSQANDDFCDRQTLPRSDVITQESSNDDNISYTYDSDSDDDIVYANTPEPDTNTQIMNEFKEYTHYAYRNFCDLTVDQEAGIELMSLLSEARVPLSLYDKIYKWHLKYIDSQQFLNQPSMVKYLKRRYYMEKSAPITTNPILLPHSKARVSLVIHKFREQVGSLLTDPRIRDHDFLFHDNNPFQAPPPDFEVVGDINTGLAYRETYDKLIDNPNKQVLLPIIFYMDGAVTGQFQEWGFEHSISMHPLMWRMTFFTLVFRIVLTHLPTKCTTNPTKRLPKEHKEDLGNLINNAQNKYTLCR